MTLQKLLRLSMTLCEKYNKKKIILVVLTEKSNL